MKKKPKSTSFTIYLQSFLFILTKTINFCDLDKWVVRVLGLFWSSRKTWLLTTPLLLFSPFIFPSKKRGKRKGEWNSKNRDQKSYHSTRSFVFNGFLNGFLIMLFVFNILELAFSLAFRIIKRRWITFTLITHLQNLPGHTFFNSFTHLFHKLLYNCSINNRAETDR